MKSEMGQMREIGRTECLFLGTLSSQINHRRKTNCDKRNSLMAIADRGRGHFHSRVNRNLS
jgi:hypothetical protein